MSKIIDGKVGGELWRKERGLQKTALITGINGQDGSYLAEFLLQKGYEVHGILKRNSVAENQTARLDTVFDKLHLHYGDLNDLSSLIAVLQNVNPDEIYNLAHNLMCESVSICRSILLLLRVLVFSMFLRHVV